MLNRARKKTASHPNIRIVEHDIRNPYAPQYTGYFDAALIAFVFHGFTDEEKKQILDNLRNILKPGGKFYILDYMQVEYEKQNIMYRGFMKKFECPLATEFLRYDLEDALYRHGFKLNRRVLYLRGLIQLAEFVRI
jgi:demethylmenaquinone methyltransferase/2-methoxy-6-polyprenyl-1,4-benzoquinol methylase